MVKHFQGQPQVIFFLKSYKRLTLLPMKDYHPLSSRKNLAGDPTKSQLVSSIDAKFTSLLAELQQQVQQSYFEKVDNLEDRMNKIATVKAPLDSSETFELVSDLKEIYTLLLALKEKLTEDSDLSNELRDGVTAKITLGKRSLISSQLDFLPKSIN